MKKKLLIIENEGRVLNVLKDVADQSSFECETEITGQTYMEKAVAFRPHAILMNLNTSLISGLGIIRNYRQHPQLKSIPIIVYSQIGEPMVVREALDLGANAYFGREEDIGEVLETVRDYIEYG